MPSFAAATLRRLGDLLRGHSGAGAGAALHEQPSPVVLDGLSAVTLAEACACEGAALGSSHPASTAARLWNRRRQAHAANAFGQLLGAVEADSPRGALAAAIGMAASGERAVAFLSGPDLAGAGDLLAQAAGLRLALVVHLACRAGAAHAHAIGSGHEAYTNAAGSGWLQLFAANAQEAVDLALIARRVAERALVPALVAMDAEQTATALQDVRLPDEGLVRSLLGEPSRAIAAPTDAQKLLYGDTRRALPRAFDLERPMLLSPLEGPEAWALGAAGARAFFDAHVPAVLADACEAFAAATGRRYAPLALHRTDDASIVLVAQGSTVETAIALADRERAEERRKIGVVGVRALRPLPGAALVSAVSGKAVVAVLERTGAGVADDAPLTTELRAALLRARENAEFGPGTHAGYPSLSGRELPRIVTVRYGAGGLALRASDLTALVKELAAGPQRTHVWLGLDANVSAGAHPKRQALADRLRRGYPDLDAIGLRSRATPPDLRPAHATTIAIHRTGGGEGESLAAATATLVHATAGGGIRGRAACGWRLHAEALVDRVVHVPAGAAAYDPGDDGVVDLAVLSADGVWLSHESVAALARGGAVLAPPACAPQAEAQLAAQGRDDVRLLTIDAADADALLGGIARVLADRVAGPSFTWPKLAAAHEASLDAAPEIATPVPAGLVATIGDPTSGGEAASGASIRERRIVAFRRGYESLRVVEPSSVVAAPVELAERAAPPLLRHLARADERQDSLPRFWSQTGVLYESGSTADLSVDPYFATGAVPPLSSMLRSSAPAGDVLPVFDPATCDGHGRLWTTCPDGSVAALAISPKALLDAGIALASEAGHPADALRRIAGKLARRASRIVRDGDGHGLASELLASAYTDVCAEFGSDAALDAALDAVVREIGDLPLARTEAFFEAAEREAAGSGELLALVVNPDAMKSAELLLATSEGRGLRAVPKTADSVEAARRLWALWQRLPDTPGATIRRVTSHPDVGPLAAMLLSRHTSLAMAGGDGAEPASGAKLALRWTLAAAEHHLQPIVQKQLADIEDLRARLAERTRSLLADALPTGDLDALADGLELFGRSDVDLADLTAKVEHATGTGRVDGARLARLVEVARGLADLSWRMSKGPAGLGRARTGLAIAPGSAASWTAVFPHNPFASPAVVDPSGETVQLATGLLEGQMRQALAGVRLLRWARLELERPNAGDAEHAALSQIGFADLTVEERQACAPVVVVGDGDAFGGRAASQLAWLLDSKLPVKILVLDEIGGRADAGAGVDVLASWPPSRRADVGLLGLLARSAFVVQTSPADPAHFAGGVARAFAFDGPALIHVHAPSPGRHGFRAAELFERARAAVASRAFPLFVFDPSREGVFGSRLELDANPDAGALWVQEAAGVSTPADWALGERRFAHAFAPLAPSDPLPTPVAEYLALDPRTREGRTPFVTSPGEPSRRLRVLAPLVADADDRARLWRTLQELAGVATPFTREVREQANADVAAAHAAEIAALRSDYEARLAGLRAGFEAEATRRVTRGLMRLAGYAPDGAGSPDGRENAS